MRHEWQKTQRDRNDSEVDRFFARVDFSGDCWEWTGGKRNGYGGMAVHLGSRAIKYRTHRTVTAHRWMYETFVGPANGFMVLHTCDNRACVNPEHLYAGTATQNTADMVRRSRQAKGARVGQSRLTPEDVRAIRASGLTYRETGHLHGVSISTVWNIKHRHTWKHVV